MTPTPAQRPDLSSTVAPRRPTRARGAGLRARGRRLAGLGMAGLMLAGVQGGLAGVAAHAATDTGEDGGAPHAALHRTPARSSVRTVGSVVVSDVDLGNVAFSRYRAPLRGVLVTPAHARHAPLVVFSHLRTANCSGHVYGYPCPSGTHELRMDRGMTWLGESLARQGYAVLIPDVSGAWMGSNLTSPYNELDAWSLVMRDMRAHLASDVAGRSRHFGRDLRGAIDMSSLTLMVHSRSGFAVQVAQRAFSPSRLTGVLAYGPAYDAPGAEGGFTAPPPDVPYLGINGDLDNDVPFNANLWLSHWLARPRTAPALVATVPGLGHNYINRTLSALHDDDRICDTACPSAAQHERFLATTAEEFLSATVRHRATGLPLGRLAALPPHLAGLPVRWLAVAANPAQHLTPARLKPVGRGASIQVCHHIDPMDPDRPAGTCPDPDNGVVESTSTVAHVRIGVGTGFAAPVRAVHARQVSLSLAPWGSRPDHGAGTPLHVTVGLSDGRRWVGYVFLKDPAVVNRQDANGNGVYVTSTIRMALPRWVTRATTTSVRVDGGPARSSWVDVAGLDVSR